MAFLHTIRIVTFTIIAVKTTIAEEKSVVRSHDTICNNTVPDLFFEEKLVIGAPWTVYYTWKMNIKAFCLQFTFKYADPLAISSLTVDPTKMKIKPPSKKLLMLSIPSTPDMFLLEDISDVPGVFIGMGPDVVGQKREIHKMVLKLLHEGQYLLMSDCSFGTTSLSVRKSNRPKREEIEALAANYLYEEDGHPACILEKDPTD